MATRKAPPSTLVLLVRHGTTPTTGRVLPGRAADLHLTDGGRAQAEQVAERLQGVGLAAIYTSPLERARETAAPTSALTGLPPVEEPGLLECDVGDWTGEALGTLARRAEWRAMHTSASTFRFPGGESFAELHARMVAVLDRLHARHPGGTVACFTHADPIKMAITFALGAALESFHRVVVGTGSVSAIRLTTGQPPAVVAVNSSHGPLSALAGER